MFGGKWGFGNFLKKLLTQFISYQAFTLMGSVSWPLYIFVFLASFSVLWWPNIWPKMGFPELKKKIGSIHSIPGIYPYRVSFLTPIHFRVPSLIFGPLVAKYLAENGISGTFWKNFWLNSFIPGIYPYGVSLLTPIHFRVPSLIFGPLVAKWCLNSSGTKFSRRIPTCVAHDCKIEIFVGYFWMMWVVIRAGVYCPHLWAQLVCFGCEFPVDLRNLFIHILYGCFTGTGGASDIILKAMGKIYQMPSHVNRKPWAYLFWCIVQPYSYLTASR